MRRYIRVVSVLTGAILAGILGLGASGENAMVPAAEKHRGVSWVAASKITAANLEPLVSDHVNWIVQTPFGWQRRFDSPKIGLVTGGRVFWGETDEGLKVTTELARARGIRTMLKPHIWLGNSSGGKWRGDIRMSSDADWAKWFESYSIFIVHYASFCEANGVEALAVGTELRRTAIEHEDEWRRIIAEVRAVYKGKLTYAANWYAEFEEIPFWDALDFIGIQAYFPLSEKEDPTTGELIRGWRPHLKKIERISRQFNKPVIFTEVGYRSVASTASKPWEWPKWGSTEKADLDLQARCYEAFYHSLWDKPWFAGAYWWKWYPTHQRSGGPKSIGYTPQNKPAEKIIAKWYGKTD